MKKEEEEEEKEENKLYIKGFLRICEAGCSCVSNVMSRIRSPGTQSQLLT